MELSTEFIKGLAATSIVFGVMAIAFGFIDHYQSKREEFENSLFVGQEVKVVDQETKKVVSVKISFINCFKQEVETDKGTFTFKQILS